MRAPSPPLGRGNTLARVGSTDDARANWGRRRPRRAGRANSDAERRALAKANARPSRRANQPVREGFASLAVDGGARGNPPLAAIGYVLRAADGSLLAAHAEVIGVAGATIAEYHALLAGLRRAHELGLDRVDARSDSRLVVSHMRGERRPRNPALTTLGDEILELTTRIGSVIVTWIPSGANGAAHALVAAALDTSLDNR
jgi:ribonuclease HI